MMLAMTYVTMTDDIFHFCYTFFSRQTPLILAFLFHACVGACVREWVCERERERESAHLCVCACPYIGACLYAWMYVCMHAYMRACVFVFVCVCVRLRLRSFSAWVGQDKQILLTGLYLYLDKIVDWKDA